MPTKQSVGVIFLVELDVISVILRRRGPWNWRERKPESWPGAYQVTCHGRIELGESPPQAACREMVEELGFEPAIAQKIVERMRLISHIVYGGLEEVFTYVVLVSPGLISKRQEHLWYSLSPLPLTHVSKLRPLETKPELKYTLQPEDEFRMFGDEIESIGKITPEVITEKLTMVEPGL